MALELIDAKCKLNYRSKTHYYNALMLAIEYEQPDVAFACIIEGCDLDNQTLEGNTSLMMAIERYQIEIAQTLIEAGCDLNIENKTGTTALMLSITHELPQITKIMIEAGCEIQAKIKQVRIFV